MSFSNLPDKQGLYDPRFEHDSCGVGFVCDIKGRQSHDIVEKGIEVLEHLSHRGAVGADPDTGDGAGLTIQMPHKFLAKECGAIGISLPGPGFYGAGMVFLPTDEKDKKICTDIFKNVIVEEGQKLLGWRDVAVDSSVIGKSAKDTLPFIAQVFIGRNKALKDELAFERKLYVIRKQIESAVKASAVKQKSFFYITNISTRTLGYKGLLMPRQLRGFFPDLNDAAMESSL
jgi:glutamate synthase domain-containing protein 1